MGTEMVITNKMINKKISQWISSTKQRNKHKSIFNRYYCPTKDEIYNQLTVLFYNGMICSECKKQMSWEVTYNKSISLHHTKKDFRLICFSCNNKLGEKDVSSKNRKSFTCVIGSAFYDIFTSVKTDLGYSPERRGYLLEDIFRYIGENKEDFYKFLDLSIVEKNHKDRRQNV